MKLQRKLRKTMYMGRTSGFISAANRILRKLKHLHNTVLQIFYPSFYLWFVMMFEGTMYWHWNFKHPNKTSQHCYVFTLESLNDSHPQSPTITLSQGFQ